MCHKLRLIIGGNHKNTVTKNTVATPTQNHLTKQFTEVDYREPHRDRRKAILKAHPEIKKMFRFDRRTILVTVLVNVAHIGLAYLLGRYLTLGLGTVALVVASSFFIGAVLSHWLAMSIHECSHNLAAKKPLTNRLVSIFAGLGTLIPGAMTFHRYHIDHHTYLGVEDRDTDLAQKFEFNLIGNSTLRKAVTLLLFPALYMIRGCIFMKKPDRWEVANLIIQMSFNVALFFVVGPIGLLYLALSLWFGHGIHPVAAHFVHEHYLFDGSQETYSYYGILNKVTFNVGYHYEHHDLMDIPGWDLPKLRAMIPQYYEPLISHRSWTWVLWHYVTSPTIGPYTRRVRHVKTHKMNQNVSTQEHSAAAHSGVVQAA